MAEPSSTGGESYGAAASNLAHLAHLVRIRNELERAITAIVQRPATIGHLGEYIAASIFGIALQHSATAKGIDGHFNVGPLQGRSVNVKWYAAFQGLLDITPNTLPNTYLVLAGPRGAAISSRGRSHPWIIDSAYLFDAHALIESLRERGVAIGIATSVTKPLWDRAQIYPEARNPTLVLNEEQRALLALFASAVGTRATS